MSTALPKNYEQIQRNYTSDSRGTRMGRRVAKNAQEMAPYLKPPICCVGCGDGWEVEQLSQALGIQRAEIQGNILGVEVTKDRVSVAQANNLPVVEGAAENLADIVGDTKYNIYCAHTLEHCFDRKIVVENFKKIALDTIVIIVPVEIRGRTRNRAHYSPISNLGVIANLFGMDWKTVNMSYRYNIELEGVLVLKRDPMNWPRKSEGRSSDLLITGV